MIDTPSGFAADVPTSPNSWSAWTLGIIMLAVVLFIGYCVVVGYTQDTEPRPPVVPGALEPK